MWRPMVGSRAIGLHILFFLFFLDFPMVFHPHWSPHFVFFVFQMVFQFPLVSTFYYYCFFCFPNGFSPPLVSTSWFSCCFLFSQWFFTPSGLHIWFVCFCFPMVFHPPLVSIFNLSVVSCVVHILSFCFKGPCALTNIQWYHVVSYGIMWFPLPNKRNAFL